MLRDKKVRISIYEKMQIRNRNTLPDMYYNCFSLLNLAIYTSKTSSIAATYSSRNTNYVLKLMRTEGQTQTKAVMDWIKMD
jgi:hypothetical protein